MPVGIQNNKYSQSHNAGFMKLNCTDKNIYSIWVFVYITMETGVYVGLPHIKIDDFNFKSNNNMFLISVNL